MKKLKDLIAEENEITDFSDLENLPSLYSLNLRKNSIKKIKKPLPYLTNLYNLNISENLIENFKELYKVPILRSILSLNFSQNPCNDTLVDQDPKMHFFIKFDYF